MMSDKFVPDKICAILKGCNHSLDTLSSDRNYRLRIFKTREKAEYFLKNYAAKNDSIYAYHSNESYNSLLLKKCKLEKEVYSLKKEAVGLKTTIKNLERYKSVHFDNLWKENKQYDQSISKC